MKQHRGVAFSTLTTLRVGGPAQSLVDVETREELIEQASSLGPESFLVLGGGSNLVVSDSGVNDPVIAVRTSGVEVHPEGERVVVRVAAGESWDAFVTRCVAEGWSGVEALAGIPGTVGATPIQNVGAYGQEVSSVVTRVDVYDRAASAVLSMTAAECHFRYRSSVFKDQPHRFVVMDVWFSLARSGSASPVEYAELAQRLEISAGEAAPADAVRSAVLDLRRSKGMVLDDTDHDTWSAGSFFMNPVLPAPEVPAQAPAWPQLDGRVKTSAAWLIERAGFAKGYGADLGTGRATLSHKHTLAITNRGGCTTEDVVLLARTVRDGVHKKFGVMLHHEPMLVGVQL